MNQMNWELSLTKDKLQAKQYQIQESLKTGHASQTAFGQTILNQQINDIATEIHSLAEVKTRGVGGAYSNTLVKAATELDRDQNYKQNYHKLAYMGLSTVLSCVYHKKKKYSYASHIGYEIGKALEEEHTMYMFKSVHTGLAFSNEHHSNRTEYEDKRRLNIYKLKQQWDDKITDDWGTKTRIHVGMRVLRAILTVMSDYLELKKVFTATRHEQVVKPTKELDDFLVEHTEYILKTTITSQPCIEPPLPWVLQDKYIVGGFHSLEMGYNRPFVKLKTPEQREWLVKHVPLKHMQAVNACQNVAWDINEDVLRLIEQAMTTGIFPAHIPALAPPVFPDKPEDESQYYQWKKDRFELVKLNKQRIAKLAELHSVLGMAKQLLHNPLWFVYTTDFRGRIYCSSGTLNTQGPKYVRALLRFHKGKALGSKGLYWLAVHGANTYGYDSHSFDDRHQWVLDNVESIRAVAQKPDSSRGRSFLGSADDPFGFYAFCREWAAAHDSLDPEAFVSHLPVMLDGSANGIQHYSALLCDQEGAERTNLTASKVPHDIYNRVAGNLRKLLTEDKDSSLATTVLKGGIDRQLVKTPVMTMTYGITLRGISLTLCNYIDDHADRYDLQEGALKNWGVITYLTENIMKVIHDDIKSPKKVMDWLQDVAMSVSMEDKQIKWISPVGFPVCQPYERFRESMIQTSLFGTKKIMYRDIPLGIDKTKAKTALAPNYIHSLDSAHLVLTIEELCEADVTQITCIHDAVGTPAADTEQTLQALRHAMYILHSQNLLQQFRQQMLVQVERVKAYPVHGTYDIQEVLEAEYFFN